MRYYGSVTIATANDVTDPAVAFVEMSPGRITEFYRLFPPGCAGLVRLQVFWQTRQIFPTTPGESYIGDGSEILGLAGFEIDEVPAILELRAWNTGTSYSHVIYCEFFIEKVRIMIPAPLVQVQVPGV